MGDLGYSSPSVRGWGTLRYLSDVWGVSDAEWERSTLRSKRTCSEKVG